MLCYTHIWSYDHALYPYMAMRLPLVWSSRCKPLMGIGLVRMVMKLGLVSELCLLVTASEMAEATPGPSSVLEAQWCSHGGMGDVVASWVRAGMCKSNSCLLASSCFASSLYTKGLLQDPQIRGWQHRRERISIRHRKQPGQEWFDVACPNSSTYEP
jgi:hypothetical protein